MGIEIAEIIWSDLWKIVVDYTFKIYQTYFWSELGNNLFIASNNVTESKREGGY